MNEEQKQELEELIFKAVQSGKQETSGLVNDILKRIDNSRSKEQVLIALDEYFNRGIDKKKFVDVSRIPLICQDIGNIHVSLSKIEDNILWIVRLIVGAVILALLGLIFK